MLCVQIGRVNVLLTLLVVSLHQDNMAAVQNLMLCAVQMKSTVVPKTTHVRMMEHVLRETP